MVFKLSKKGHILQFCDDLSKKTKSIKVIYIDASDGYCYALWANGIAYYAIKLWLTVLEISGLEIEEFC